MPWSVVSQVNSDWGRTPEGSIWDDGASPWDLDGNIPQSVWDVSASDPWEQVPGVGGDWSIVT